MEESSKKEINKYDIKKLKDYSTWQLKEFLKEKQANRNRVTNLMSKTQFDKDATAIQHEIQTRWWGGKSRRGRGSRRRSRRRGCTRRRKH